MYDMSPQGSADHRLRNEREEVGISPGFAMQTVTKMLLVLLPNENPIWHLKDKMWVVIIATRKTVIGIFDQVSRNSACYQATKTR